MAHNGSLFMETHAEAMEDSQGRDDQQIPDEQTPEGSQVPEGSQPPEGLQAPEAPQPAPKTDAKARCKARANVRREMIDLTDGPDEIYLKHSGNTFEKGKVIVGIAKKVIKALRELRDAVKHDRESQKKLETFARAIEHPKTTKKYLIGEQKEILRAVTAAKNKVDKHFTTIEDFVDSLLVEEWENIFKDKILEDAMVCKVKAEKQQKTIVKLFKDLGEYKST